MIYTRQITQVENVVELGRSWWQVFDDFAENKIPGTMYMIQEIILSKYYDIYICCPTSNYYHYYKLIKLDHINFQSEITGQNL